MGRASIVGALVVLAGCGGPPPLLLTSRESDTQGALGERCSPEVANKPYVIKMRSTTRGELESRLRKGLALVKYSGCDLEVIQDCSAPANLAYAWVGLTPKNDELKITTAAELYAQVPIGAAELAAQLQRTGELSIRSMIVGRYESPVQTLRLGSLEGRHCDEATHGIRAVSAGAFKLFSGRSATDGAKVGAGDIAIGAKSQAKAEELTSDGDMAKCSLPGNADGPQLGCGALIQLELVPVDQTPAAPTRLAERVCPPGQVWEDYYGCRASEQIAEPAPSTRFVPQGGAVFDTSTGLTWQRFPAASTLPWEEAKRFCLQLTLDGISGWRLPRRKELATLVDDRQPGAKIDSASFPDTPAARFWTMSSDTSSPGDAWTIDFHRGAADSRGSGRNHNVRCVR